MKIGWAFTDITPQRPVYLSGQLYVRVSRYVHDPVTASALALEDGEEQAVFVSMDMVAVPDYLMEAVRKGLGGKEGPDPDKVSICVTHTHNSSRFGVAGNEGTLRYMGRERVEIPEAPRNILWGEEARKFLTEKILGVILDAWENRREGSLGSACDYAAVGFNRRPVFQTPAGEEAKMYGDCSGPDFLRFEGTVDHSAHMLYTWNEEGKLTGVAVNIPCPSQVMELHYFISADYWHYARKKIREKLGDIHILPLCGAAGDQNPLDLIQISKDNREELKLWNGQAGEVFRNLDMTEACEDIGERIGEAVARGYGRARNARWSRPVFRHRIVHMDLPLRTVTEEAYREAMKYIEECRERFSPDRKMNMEEQKKLYGPIGVAERYHQQKKGAVFPVELHILRIQDTVIVTQPFELFVEYGLRIRAACRAGKVFNIQLCSGHGDYLPTEAAIRGGSYSSEPASTYVGPEGGELLTARLIEEANRLFEA